MAFKLDGSLAMFSCPRFVCIILVELMTSIAHAVFRWFLYWFAATFLAPRSDISYLAVRV